MLKYHLAVAHLPYGGTEAGARVPPIALNRFSCFLKRGGRGRDKLGAPTCQGRVRTEVGPGTEARAKVINRLTLATSGLPRRPGPFGGSGGPPPQDH